MTEFVDPIAKDMITLSKQIEDVASTCFRLADRTCVNGSASQVYELYKEGIAQLSKARQIRRRYAQGG